MFTVGILKVYKKKIRIIIFTIVIFIFFSSFCYAKTYRWKDITEPFRKKFELHQGQNVTIEIHFSNPFSEKRSKFYNEYYKKLIGNQDGKLNIIGGFKLKYYLQSPHGNEFKNSMEHCIFDVKNFSEN